MEKTDQAIAKIIEAINAAAMQHGAAGVELALTAVATKAQLSIGAGVACLVLAFWFYRCSLPWLRNAKERYGDEADGAGVMCAVSWFASTIATTIAGILLLSPTTWASAINPQLGLAMRILDKVL